MFVVWVLRNILLQPLDRAAAYVVEQPHRKVRFVPAFVMDEAAHYLFHTRRYVVCGFCAHIVWRPGIFSANHHDACLFDAAIQERRAADAALCDAIMSGRAYRLSVGGKRQVHCF